MLLFPFVSHLWLTGRVMPSSGSLSSAMDFSLDTTDASEYEQSRTPYSRVRSPHHPHLGTWHLHENPSPRPFTTKGSQRIHARPRWASTLFGIRSVSFSMFPFLDDQRHQRLLLPSRWWYERSCPTGPRFLHRSPSLVLSQGRQEQEPFSVWPNGGDLYPSKSMLWR